MMMRRLTPVAVLLAGVLVMSAGAVKAETVRIAVPASVTITTEVDFIAVTGVTYGTEIFSGACTALGFTNNPDSHPVKKVVILDADNIPRVSVVDTVVLQRHLDPGTRLFNVKAIGSCTDGGTSYNIYEGTIASPQNFDIALVNAPAGVTLTAEHECVVGAGTDELGLADAVCVKKGEKSIKTVIESDIDLEAGDRLTGFTEIFFDFETGQTLYGAFVEY